MLNEKTIKKNTGLFILFLLTSIAFLIFYSVCTSWLYSYMAQDAAIYWFSGKMIKSGMTPYIDFFDHKGPVLLFLEYLGNIISNDTLGIFLIQLLFMNMTIWGIYKILRLFFSSGKSVIITLLSVLIMPYIYENGNLTEEYCLPFLLFSIYFGTKFLIDTDKKNRTHKPIYAFFYGISFMFCALIRVTNALPLCCNIFIILLLLCHQRKWKNILHNAGMFILGAFIVFLPFFLYFLKINALYEMIYATFIYNAKYVVSNSETLIHSKLSQIIVCTSYYLFGIILSMLHFFVNKNNRELAFSIFFTSCVGLLFQLTNRPFTHYILIFMPTIVLTLCLYSCKKLFRIPICIITYLSITFIVLHTLMSNFVMIQNNIRILNKKSGQSFREASLDIAVHIPQEYSDKVIAYNVNPYFYSVTELLPCYKYFILQDWHSESSSETKKEIRTAFESLDAKYIITAADSKTGIDDILENNYCIETTNNRLTLWKLK